MMHPDACRLAALVAVALLAGATLFAETQERLRVYVAAEGEVEPTTVKEVVKRIKKRDEWFSLAEDREGSDLVVTLRRQWKEKHQRMTYEWRVSETGAHAGSAARLATMPVLEEVFFLEAEIRAGEDPPTVVKQSGRRAKEAAQAFAKNLELWCKQRGLAGQ